MTMLTRFVQFLILFSITYGQKSDCPVCKVILHTLRSSLTATPNQDYQTLLGTICPDSVCMDTYLPHMSAISASFTKFKNDTDICVSLGLCKIKSSVFTGGIPQSDANPSKFSCIVCESLQEEVWEEMISNLTLDKIEKMWDNICLRLQPLKPICDKKNIAKLIHNFILNLDSPCENLGLCDTTHKNTNSITIQSHPLSSTTTNMGDLNCAICQGVMTIAKNELNGDNDPATIQRVMNNLCGTVPVVLQSGCHELLLQESILVVALRSNVDITTICERVHFCKQETLLSSPPNPGQFSSAMECQTCQWAVSGIESYFSQDSSEQQLAAIFQELCTIMPNDYAQVCESFVLVYTPDVMLFLLESLTPPVVCKMIGLC